MLVVTLYNYNYVFVNFIKNYVVLEHGRVSLMEFNIY